MDNNDDSEQEEIKNILLEEDYLEEIETTENIELLSTNVNSVYAKKPLWVHQSQALHAMLIAEDGKDIVNTAGERFNSNFGILALPTGTGKTNTVLSVSSWGVPEREDKLRTIYSSLGKIQINEKPRINIPCTIICTDDSILKDAWERDIINFFGGVEVSPGQVYSGNGLPYYRFTTMGTFETSVKSDPNYISQVNNIQMLKNFLASWENHIKNNNANMDDFVESVTSLNEGKIKTFKHFDRFIIKLERENKDYFVQLYNRKIVEILSNVRVAFVTNNAFEMFIGFFKNYTVDRLVFDEPQKLVLRNQDKFREYVMDKKFESVTRHFRKMESSAKGSLPTIFCEMSPAKFIWFCTATPYDIINNSDNKRYINAWVDRNTFIIHDFINHDSRESRLFPEMVAKYIVKFKYSYISNIVNPYLKYLVRKINIRTKRSIRSTILTGVFGDDVDQMIENNNMDGIYEKLNKGKSAADILDIALRKLYDDITKGQKELNDYSPDTPKHVVENKNKEIASKIEKYNSFKQKISIFRGEIHDEESLTCVICKENVEHKFIPIPGESDLNKSKRMGIVHTSCMNCFHHYCFNTWRHAANNKNHTCSICRQPIEDSDISIITNQKNESLAAQENLQLAKQQSSNSQEMNVDYMCFEQLNKTYETKSLALEDILKPCLVAPFDWNTKTFPENYSLMYRRKILLFMEFNNINHSVLIDVVKILVARGFNVRLPITVTPVKLLTELFPNNTGAKVSHKSTNISKEIEIFKLETRPTVWIFRSLKESAGLNFEFVDTIICYSKFAAYKQIIGRGLRLTRKTHFDFITFSTTANENVTTNGAVIVDNQENTESTA